MKRKKFSLGKVHAAQYWLLLPLLLFVPPLWIVNFLVFVPFAYPALSQFQDRPSARWKMIVALLSLSSVILVYLCQLSIEGTFNARTIIYLGLLSTPMNLIRISGIRQASERGTNQ